jgi:hypothetical protein
LAIAEYVRLLIHYTPQGVVSENCEPELKIKGVGGRRIQHITFHFTSQIYDFLAQRAQSESLSMSEWLRDAFTRLEGTAPHQWIQYAQRIRNPLQVVDGQIAKTQYKSVMVYMNRLERPRWFEVAQASRMSLSTIAKVVVCYAPLPAPAAASTPRTESTGVGTSPDAPPSPRTMQSAGRAKGFGGV